MGKITSDKNIPFGTQPYSFNHPNIPCFTKLDVQEAFRKKIHMICDKRKVCPKKKFTRVCSFYVNLVSFYQNLNINPKSRHSKDSKMVR